jgi:hypothetical protein
MSTEAPTTAAPFSTDRTMHCVLVDFHLAAQTFDVAADAVELAS